MADLTGFGPAPFNELVVDAQGKAYVNGGPGSIVCVWPDGSVREVADGLKWPDGICARQVGPHRTPAAHNSAHELSPPQQARQASARGRG
jgi:hypothetical protein